MTDSAAPSAAHTTGIESATLRVAPGETLAIIGPSGSGKSTLARLLDRDVDPDHGAVLLDGIDLRDFTPRARARSVVTVEQDPVLFAWTVAENLRLHRPEATAEEIEAAARIAHVHELVLALPRGYDTVPSENGDQLSGGQRQRLAIARALLSPAPVLVLDEVTSALDVETERRVIDALAHHTRDRTVVIIAHRRSACLHADRWLALRAGRIVQTGLGTPSDRDLARSGAT